MSVSIKTLKELLPIIASQRNPILIRGRHGIGKSELVYEYAKEVNKEMVERRLSQMTEGDMSGLPNKAKMDKENVTEWCIPDFLQRACNNPCILFLDEIDRASIEVRQAVFQLGDSRRIGKWSLHPDTVLFAACNGGENTSQYQVGELDPAELDRWTTIDFEPTVDEWIEWGKKNNNIHSSLLTFIGENPKHLEHEKDFEPGKKYPSRRSWKRLNDALVASNMFSEENKNNYCIISLATSYVGFEASIALADYMKNATFTVSPAVSPEEIMDKGEIDKIKDFKITDHLALIEKINLKGYYTKKLTKKQVNNLSNFFVKLPSEIAMKLIIDIGRGSDNTEIIESNLKELYKANDNQVNTFIKTILSNPETVEALTKTQESK